MQKYGNGQLNVLALLYLLNRSGSVSLADFDPVPLEKYNLIDCAVARQDRWQALP
jgi:hypothetical protein